MLSCLICFKSLEFSSDNVMSIPQCGHVFHGNCVNKWLEVNPGCPKCRVFCNSKALLKLYFGTETLEDEVEDITEEINLLKYESDLHKQHIENCMEIIMQDLDLISENTNSILTKKRKLDQIAHDRKQENLMRFKLKDLFVSLNRQEDRQRIDDYLQSRNSTD